MKELIKVIGLQDSFLTGDSDDQYCTKGKEYDVIDINENYFEIKDDTGYEHSFSLTNNNKDNFKVSEIFQFIYA
jgi:hypothetical protein